MAKRWSVDDVNLEEYKKKKWSVDDVDFSEYDFGVDDDYINTFLKDSQEYINSQSYNTNSYSGGIKSYDDFANSDIRNDLSTRANNIRAYLNANKNQMDSQEYNDVMSYLDNYKKHEQNQLNSLAYARNYYSQWASEADFLAYTKNNDKKLKYESMSLEDLRKEKDEYERIKGKVNFNKNSQVLATSGNPQADAISKLVLGLMDEKSQNKDEDIEKWYNEYKDNEFLYKDTNGIEYNYDKLISKKILEEIKGDTSKQSAYDKALEASEKLEEANTEYSRVVAALTEDKDEYAQDALVSKKKLLEGKIKELESVVEDFNSLGYDFDKLHYYQSMVKNAEAEAKNTEEAIKFADEGGIDATLKQFVTSPMMIVEYAKNLIDTAKYGYADIYDDKNINQNRIYSATVGQNIDDWVTDKTGQEWAGWLASTAYSGVTSGVQSLAIGAIGTALSGGNAAIGTGAAMSVLGTQVAASSYNEAIRNGSTSGEAVAYSVAAGIGEALFEKLPLDNIFKLAKGVGKSTTKEGIVTLLKGLAKQSAIEGLEEGGTELWNTMADAIINGDHSAYNIAVENYIKQGYSKTDARKMASKDWLGELFTSMVAGAIGGAAIGGMVGTPSFAINQARQNAQYDAVGNATIQNQNVPDLVADAQSLITEGEKSAISKLANEVAGVENVDNLSKKEAKKYTRNVGKLVTEVTNTKVNSIKAAQSEAIKHELEANGVEDVSRATDVVIKKMSGQTLTEAETKVFESVDGNTIIENVKKHEVKSAVDKDNLQRVEDSFAKTVEIITTKSKSVQHQEMVEESGYTTTEGKTTVDATGVEVDSMIIDSLEGDDVSLKVNMGEDSDIVLAGDLNLNDNYAVMIEGLKRIGKKFSLNTSSANKLLALYEAYNGDAFTFYKAMEAGISYGHYNIRDYFDNNKFVAELPQEYQEKLYEIGRENAQTTAEESQASVELERKANAESKVTFTEDVKYHKLNKSKKAQVDFAITIAKTFGFDLEIFRSPKNAQGKSIGENGSYSVSRNLMRLDIDAGTLDGKSLILFTQGHELTHYIKSWSPVKYKVFADFLMEHYAKSDVLVQDLINKKIEQSKISAVMDKTGRHHVLTESEAFDEIVANACEDFLADPNIQQTILMIAKVDQSIAQKIKNFIKNLVARLEKAIRGLQGQSKEAEAVRKLDVDAIEKLKDLWTEALLDARENVIVARENVAPEVQEVIEEFGEDLGNVEYNEDGDVTLISSEDDSTQVYSERTWLNGGKEALVAALTRNEHTQEEINDTVKMVEDTLDYLKILAAGDAQMRGYTELANNLVADITTDIKGKKQVLHAIVNNGDYPVNIDLALICKKRVAYMNVMTRLIADGVMENVKYDGDAIAEVNAILRKNGFETACLGCFVESRRLQFQTWAETIVQEWNGEVDKRNKNAGSFNYTKNAFTDASSLTDEELNKLDKELSGKKKNKQGNLNLGQGSAIVRMGKLLDSAPTLQKHISVADLLTPEGLTKLRAENPNLFSIVKSRYGAATPEIVQKYNPYASELANLTFKSVSDITTNSVKGSQEYLKEAKKELASSKPSLPKGMKASAFNKSKEMKDWNAKVETLAMRKYLYDIGGARMQSFSDFMIENVFDYMQIFADLAANKFPLHSYTKEIAFLRLFGMTGAKINGSLIAHVDKSFSKRYAGLLSAEEAKKGNAILVHTEDGDYAIGFDDYSRHMATKRTDGETFIQSIGMKDIIALQMDKRYSKNIGSITIGVSDAQILAMLDSPLFRMVIPYHSSGMLPQFAKLVGVDMYNDYTDYQNTTVKQYYDLNKNPLPDEVDDKGKTKLGTFKKANGKSINADTSYSFNAELQKIGDPKIVADNYVAWCNEFHEVYDGKTLVGYAKFNPKFSNSPYGTDFTKHENYYKLLEDFNVYDGITEQYASQGAVEMIFPSAENRLSAAEMEEYKQRLRDTGIFTEKEIEKYAKKADMTFEELLKAEVKNRVAYEDEQNPKWESTIKEIEDELKGKYSRVNKPSGAYSYDWQHQDRNANKTSQEFIEDTAKSFGITNIGDYIHVQRQVMATLLKENFFTDNELRSRTDTNKMSGMVVETNKSGINETFDFNNYARLGKSKKALKLATIRHLPEIIENGELYEDNVSDEHKNSPNKKFAYIQFEIDIDGKQVLVKIDIKKSPRKNKFWVHRVDIKAEANDSPTITNKVMRQGDNIVDFEDNLPQSSANVNIQSLQGDEQFQDRYIRYGKLTQNRIDYLIKDSGAGSRVDYANKWIASISPSDFIDLTLRYETRVKGREVFDTKVGGDYGSVMGDRDYIHEIRHNRELPYLMVDMETGKVLGHNGRHRMRALEMAGASRTPIGIIFYKDDRVYKGDDNGVRLESIDFQRLTSQFDDKSYLQHNAYIHNIIPLNEDHRTEIEGTYRADKFEVEHFDVLAYQDRPYKPSLEDLGIQRENEKLKADVENLKEMLKLQSTVTHGKVLAKAKYKDIAKKLLHDFGMKQVKDEKLLNGFVNRLDEYFSGIINSDELTWEFVMEGAYKVAKWVDYEMPTETKLKYDYAEEILSDIRSAHIVLDDLQKAEVAYYYGSYNAFRKSLFGSTNLVNKGISLDSQWQEWSNNYPNIFDADISTNDMPIKLAEIIGDMKETAPVLNEEEQVQRIDWMAGQIYDAYWLMPTVKTLADKHQLQVNLLKGKHREQMDALRESYKTKELKTKEDYKKHYEEMLKKVKEHKDAQLESYKEHVKEVKVNEKDRKNRTVMKNRIKGVVKELNSILSRGTKDRNVKLPIQPAVMKALELAEFLFDDDLSNNFILTQADINPRDEEMEDLAYYRKYNKEREQHMQTLLSLMELKGTESEVAKLKDTIKKYEAQMAYREKKLSSLITNEKKKLQQDGVGKAVKALAEAYSQLKNSEEDYVKEAYNEGVYNYIDGLANRLEGAKVKEMSESQMFDVYTAFKAVLTTVRDANKLFVNGKREDVQKMSSAIMMQISSNKKTKTVPYEKLDSLKGKMLQYSWNELKPYYAFQRIGSSTLMKLYEAARQGEDILGRDYREAIEFAEKIKNKYGYDSWDMNKRYDITLEDGRTFTVTLQEIMSIYAYSKREQAYDHMMFGGFVFNNKKFFKANEGAIKGLVKPKTYRSTDAEAYRLSVQDLTEISKIISKVKGLKGFVDEMQGYLSTDMAAKGNEISRVLYGVDWFNEKNYFPIKSSRDFLAIVNNPSENYSLRNSGMTKTTVPHAKNPLVLEDFMTVWAEHVGKMSTYHSLVIPIDNLNKVLGYKEASTSMKTVLDSVFGKSAKEYLDNFLKDLNGGVSSQGAKSPLGSMFGKFKKTAVAASTSVVVQQPTAILRAMAEIDGKYFVGASDKLKHNEKWELIKKYAPIAVIKELGGFDIGSGKKIETILTTKSYKGKGKVKGFLTDSQYRNEAADNAFMWGATKADEIGWNIIWSAVEREIKDTTNLKSGTEEFYKKVGERFTEVVHKTQVYDSTFTRSGYQRSKNDLVQMSMSFMGEPTTSFNMLYDAILQSSRKNISKGKKYRIIGATVSSIIFAAIAKSLIYALRDDDDDKSYLEKYVESTTENLVSDLIISNMLPFVKDITSIISGWEVERTDMAIFTDIYKSFKQLDSDTVSDYRKVEDLIGSLASLFGVPAKNLLRTGREMRNVVKNIFDNNLPYGQGVADAAYRGLPFTQDKSKTDKLYRATVNGTQAYLDKFEGEDIDNSLKKGLRDNDKRILQGVDALLDSDYTKYGSIVNQIVAEGKFTKEVVSGAIQSEANYFGGKIEEGALALRDGDKKTHDEIVRELRDRYRGIYTQDEIVKMIKNYEFEAEEESDEEESIYKTKYIADALEKGDTHAATEMIEDIVATKVANGKTEEEARKSVRSSLTRYWKPLFEQAFADGSVYEQNEIRESLYDMGVYGTYEEIDDTIHHWKQDYVLENYKPQYIQAYEAGDTYTMQRIENEIYDLGVYKNAYKTVRGWID